MFFFPFDIDPKNKICLLYTSDAADERSSVDLGGRRIIKKKKQENVAGRRLHITDKYKIQAQQQSRLTATVCRVDRDGHKNNR